MPRRARIDAPGILQHVIIRGKGEKTIFRDDRDRDDFLARLEALLREGAAACYAWALMPGQVRLLLRTGPTPLATIMRRLLTGYARYFNRRYRSQGRVFQDRYKSVACEEKPFFRELVRAVHVAPLRAGHVKTLKELRRYRYSGHGALLGEVVCEWQDRAEVLARFGKTIREGRAAYESFVALAPAGRSGLEFTGGGLLRSVGGWAELKRLRAKKVRVKGDERILGAGKFVAKVLSQAEARVHTGARLKKRRLKVSQLVKIVARYCGVSEKAIRSGSKARPIARARALVCALGAQYGGLTGAALARQLAVTPSAVSKAVMRGKALLKERTLNRNVLRLLDPSHVRTPKARL